MIRCTNPVVTRARRRRDEAINKIIDELQDNADPLTAASVQQHAAWETWPVHDQVPLVTGAHIDNLALLAEPKETLRRWRKNDPDRLAAMQQAATEIRKATEIYATTYGRECKAKGLPV